MALRWRRLVTVPAVLGLATLGVVGPSPPAAAQTPPTPAGSFTCQASPLDLLGVRPIIAHPGTASCAPDSQGLPSLALVLATIGAVSANTGSLPGASGVTATSQLAGLDLPLLNLRAGLVQAQATVRCEGDTPVLSGTSQVAGLTVAGSPVASGDRLDVPIGLGTLHLNHTSVQGDELVVRALWIETALGNVVVGEARAGFSGNPCAGQTREPTGTITIVNEADPPGFQTFSFVGDLGPFTLPTPQGEESQAFSRPPGRYRITELRVTGGRVQRAWEVEEVRCVDPDRGTSVSLAARSLVVDLDEGENVVCTFFNRNRVLSAGTDLENPSLGLEPVVDRVGPEAQPPEDRGRVELPRVIDDTGPTIQITPAGDSSGGLGMLWLLVLLLLAGGLVFILLLATRRRKEDART